MLTGLNYIFINILIIIALYGIMTKKDLPYQKYLFAIIIALAIIYNFAKSHEGYQDFSLTNRSTLDIFCHKTDGMNSNSKTEFACNSPENPHPEDNCQHCDGLCTQGPVGKGFPPETYPLCRRHKGYKIGRAHV